MLSASNRSASECAELLNSSMGKPTYIGRAGFDIIKMYHSATLNRIGEVSSIVNRDSGDVCLPSCLRGPLGSKQIKANTRRWGCRCALNRPKIKAYPLIQLRIPISFLLHSLRSPTPCAPLNRKMPNIHCNEYIEWIYSVDIATLKSLSVEGALPYGSPHSSSYSSPSLTADYH